MKEKKKILLSMLLAVSMLASLTVTAFAADEEHPGDCHGHWAEKQIAEGYGSGLVKGHEDGTFRPDNTIIRAEFAALVNRAFGFTEKGDADFSDVPSGAWYAEDIQKAVAAGYITAAENGAVGPGEPVTRVEAAKILSVLLQWDTAGSSNTQAIEQFKDAVYIPEGGAGALNAAVARKHFQGSSDGYIQPLNYLTRAEAVTVLYKAKGGLIDEESIPVTAAEREYKGIIIDKHCFAFGEPDKDTKSCLLMPSCEASGYGIAFKKDGIWQFYQFDEEGRKLAKDILLKTEKDSNITILVRGVAEGETIKVLSILEDDAENSVAAPEEEKAHTSTGHQRHTGETK